MVPYSLAQPIMSSIGLLQGTTLSDLLAGRQRNGSQLVAFDDQCTIGQALVRLQAEGIRSAPVVASSSSSSTHQLHTTFCDVHQGPFEFSAMLGYTDAGLVVEELIRSKQAPVLSIAC